MIPEWAITLIALAGSLFIGAFWHFYPQKPKQKGRVVASAILVLMLIGLLAGLHVCNDARQREIANEIPPRVSVACWSPDGNPECIECIVENTGRTEARDVRVGFSGFLPLGTEVYSYPEVAAEIVTVSHDLGIDPFEFPEVYHIISQFNVYVPRVEGKGNVTFTVCTTEHENLRAARQVLRIRSETEEIWRQFYNFLAEEHPDYIIDWELDDWLSSREKEENMFRPDKFSYEMGTYPVYFLTDEEQLAKAMGFDLKKRFSEEYSEISDASPDLMAPVVIYSSPSGNRTIAMFTPLIDTYLQFAVPYPSLRPGEEVTFYVPPSPPDAYDWELESAIK